MCSFLSERENRNCVNEHVHLCLCVSVKEAGKRERETVSELTLKSGLFFFLPKVPASDEHRD